MSPYSKPTGLQPEHAAQFQDKSIVHAYRHREPYPEETFQILRDLAGKSDPLVADLGCGPGDLTVGLSRFASRVDAVDISAEMLREAERGGQKNIHWIHSPAESAPLAGPYDLITAGDSIHWMDWPSLFKSVKHWLKPGGHFVVVGRWYAQKDWWDGEFQSVIDRYSTNREFQKYDLIAELEKSGLAQVAGEKITALMEFTQRVEDLVEAFHSRNGFSRDRMGQSAEAFDREASALLSRQAKHGLLTLYSVSRVTWLALK